MCVHGRAFKHSWLEEWCTAVCAQQSRRNFPAFCIHRKVVQFLQKEIKMPKFPLDGTLQFRNQYPTRNLFGMFFIWRNIAYAVRLYAIGYFIFQGVSIIRRVSWGSLIRALIRNTFFPHINSTFGMFLWHKNLVLKTSIRSEFAIKLVHVFFVCVWHGIENWNGNLA